MSNLRPFAIALLFAIVCLSVALADTTVTRGDGTTVTTHDSNPVKNRDGSVTTASTLTYKDVDGKTYATETIKNTSKFGRYEDVFVRPPGPHVALGPNGARISVDDGFEESTNVITYAADGSGTARKTSTTIDPKTGTKTSVVLIDNFNSDGHNVSSERHTVTTLAGSSVENRTDEVFDAKTNEWVPAVQEADGSWVPATQTAQAPSHHGGGGFLAGLLAVGGIIAALAGHGGGSSVSNNIPTNPVSSGGGAITFAPSSITACRTTSGASATVSERGYSGSFALSSSNINVVQPTTGTTTGSFSFIFTGLHGSATITATDSNNHTAGLPITVNKC